MNHGLDGWWPWMAEPVREGVEDGIQWQIMANDVLFSWQGYAHIPDGHVRRHLNADDIEPLVDVYGGVTYGPDRQGRIGFDTLQGNSSVIGLDGENLDALRRQRHETVKGGTRMGRPLLFIDFDGVINQFPDPKVMRRQGRTDWMEPDDPRRDTYSPDNWFGPDRRERLLVRDLGRRFTIRWNAELVARLDALDADKWWLTTWQPETAQLNRALGVDWPTIRWYDPVTRDGILTGKRRTILDALKQDRPIVWLDDEETTYNAGLAIQATPHEAPVLGVGPDSAIGVGRPQMDLVEDFIHDPPAGPVVRFETAGDGHEGHWGF